MNTFRPFRSFLFPSSVARSLTIGVLAALGAATTSCMHVDEPKAPFISRVAGESMEPALHDGNHILVLGYDFDALEPEMTAVFWTHYPSPRQLVVHRVVRKLNDDAWITRGVNNPHNDNFRLTRRNFVGVVAENQKLKSTAMRN